ncbi:MAG TPA: M15 family metallopeptidase [Saprospiraceae bacterium]|nr:M15 family metallopeptidase [Lewinellaceae bacterium]HPG07954.1 M15 family metallopeptidase [Saprospiraceae bacterium]HPQ97964.1 M15 family metallopeptidase [Saprospiraceae bacterium]HRV86284.1 M15 family metallopeptidase [Saprospiraceae bacterium]
MTIHDAHHPFRVGVLLWLIGCLLTTTCGPGKGRTPEIVMPSADTMQRVGLQEPENSIALGYDYDTSRWVEIPDRAPFHLDLRYAENRNFTGNTIYPCGRCFLKKVAGEALLALEDTLTTLGMGLILWDCYRPAQAQQLLWETFPNASYVTPPSKGSMHSRGLAVDLGLTDSAGHMLDLGSDFDHFGQEAHRDFKGLAEEVRMRRQMLDQWMHQAGFAGIRTEWWHYSYRQAFAAVDSFQWTCISVNE